MLNYKFQEKLNGIDLGNILYAIDIATNQGHISPQNKDNLKKLYKKLEKCSVLYELELD